MELVPALAAAALIKKFVDTLAYFREGRIKDGVTQLLVFVFGVALALIFAASDFGGSFDVGGRSLSSLNTWGVVIVGLLLAAGGSTIFDTLQAVDRNRTTTSPKLLG